MTIDEALMQEIQTSQCLPAFTEPEGDALVATLRSALEDGAIDPKAEEATLLLVRVLETSDEKQLADLPLNLVGIEIAKGGIDGYVRGGLMSATETLKALRTLADAGEVQPFDWEALGSAVRKLDLGLRAIIEDLQAKFPGTF